MNYYNEWDKKTAAWLRVLISEGRIPPGVVDDRSITEVTKNDLKGFTQAHFFAGIGGWPLALRLAGVPDTTELWTGSPPCQPFSVAGKQQGQLDERHLAPTFMRLVDQCRPPILFGEQVAAAIGKHWLDDLFVELERQGYACGSAVLPACSVGAPHKRDRLFFGAVNRLANNMRTEWNGERLQGLGESNSTQESRKAAEFTGCSDIDELAYPDSQRLQRKQSSGDSEGRERPDIRSAGLCDRAGTASTNQDNGFWSGADWLGCRDGKFRPVEPGTFPLANGIPARVVRLRGYGNAIVPQVAAAFIDEFFNAYQECQAEKG